MHIVRHPDPAEWPRLQRRPAEDQAAHVHERVRQIFDDVHDRRDQALLDYAAELDGASLGSLRVSPEELRAARDAVAPELRRAIDQARANLHAFHLSQREVGQVVETMPGVRCWRRSLPVERVGLYIPGGTAPLFSTLLMLGVPAQIAGCKQIVLTTPPRKDGSVDPVILFTADLLGIDTLIKAGGAQAIAALTYGTESTPAVDKLFGPGNRYVTAAKQLAAQRGVAIDLPAGPSEVLVIADESARPEFVAADLLSQAEHGSDSQVILLTTSESLLDATLAQVELQLATLPRQDTARAALRESHAIVLDDRARMLDFSNQYAPEHLILAVHDAEAMAESVTNAGSVFLGHLTPESAGDYASGTNHTLPTGGYARSYSGVSLDSFVKKITFQRITAEGLRELGPMIETMAEAEGLHAHARAVGVRLRAGERS